MVNVSFKSARKCHSLNNFVVTSFFDCRGKYWSKIVMTIWEHEWYYQVSTIPMYWYCKESKKPLEAIIVVELAMEYLLMTLKSKVNRSSSMLNVSMHSRGIFLKKFRVCISKGLIETSCLIDWWIDWLIELLQKRFSEYIRYLSSLYLLNI